MTPLQLVQSLLEGSFDYATTDIKLPDEVADFIIEWGRLNIPNDALAEDGRERYIHVTVKYGLTDHELPPELKEIAKTTQPFSIFMGVVSLFTTNPKYDVVKIAVESPSLRRLNQRVSELPNEDQYPEYLPHCTIAYVAKGTCDHLEGDDPFEAEGVPREFTASGMRFRGPGNEQDPQRSEETLLFSQTKPDAGLDEAVVGPTRAQMDLILAEIKEAVRESNGDVKVFTALANEALRPYRIQFEHQPEHDYGAPAVANAEGVFLTPPSARSLRDPKWPEWLYAMLQHELVHVRQMARMDDPKMVSDKATAWMTPKGHISHDRYLQQKQEVMAWAASMVDSWRRQGLTSDQMFQRLRSGNWGYGMKYWHARRDYPATFNRFIKSATEYIEQLKESAIAQVVGEVDPFSAVDFPVDPTQTRRFLCHSGKRREERPIM